MLPLKMNCLTIKGIYISLGICFTINIKKYSRDMSGVGELDSLTVGCSMLSINGPSN